MPQRGELAQAHRLPWGTLLAQGPGAGEDDVPCTIEQHSLEVLLHPPSCMAPFVTSCALGESCRMNWFMLEKYSWKILLTLMPSGLIGGGERTCKDLTLLHAF